MDRRLLIPGAFSLLLLACGAAPGVDTVEGELADDAAEGEDALAASGRSTFYVARPDFRKCMSPMCGGAFVHRVNYRTTRCHDGVYRDECYVAELQLPADVTERGESLYRGTIRTKSYGSLGRFGVFAATEVWSADEPVAAEPTGTYFRVEASGIVCVRAPCPSLKQSKLNSSAKPSNIVRLDLAAAPGTDAQHADAAADAYASALLVVGTNTSGKDGLSLAAQQYFRRVQATPAGKAEGETCGATSECGAGLECCYPCGIQGCTNRCMQPAEGGGCPLFP